VEVCCREEVEVIVEELSADEELFCALFGKGGIKERFLKDDANFEPSSRRNGRKYGETVDTPRKAANDASSKGNKQSSEKAGERGAFIKPVDPEESADDICVEPDNGLGESFGRAKIPLGTKDNDEGCPSVFVEACGDDVADVGLFRIR
jgi:hypothetical protein